MAPDPSDRLAVVRERSAPMMARPRIAAAVSPMRPTSRSRRRCAAAGRCRSAARPRRPCGSRGTSTGSWSATAVRNAAVTAWVSSVMRPPRCLPVGEPERIWSWRLETALSNAVANRGSATAAFSAAVSFGPAAVWPSCGSSASRSWRAKRGANRGRADQRVRRVARIADESSTVRCTIHELYETDAATKPRVNRTRAAIFMVNGCRRAYRPAGGQTTGGPVA